MCVIHVCGKISQYLVLLQPHARSKKRKANRKSPAFIVFLFNSRTERRLPKPTEGNTTTALTITSEGIATDLGRSYAQDSLYSSFLSFFSFRKNNYLDIFVFKKWDAKNIRDIDKRKNYKKHLILLHLIRFPLERRSKNLT